MAREINLVPDIKNDMIKALKMKNFILFLCIIVSCAALGVVAILGTILGAQTASISAKDATLKELSNKVNSYDDLSDFLTIKKQLSELSNISDSKTLMSRSFNLLPALLPTGADTITVSQMAVDLSKETPTISFDAQANAGKEPFIDYNVLDSFKKSMPYMRYDYGRYVDAEDNEIPAYCIVETNEDGSTFSENGNVYAYWKIDLDGCNSSENKYSTEEYDGDNVVRIWRTPQYDDWYKEGHMTLDGDISGIEHFKSSCITYSGTDETSKIKWSESNDSCYLIPEGTDGITVSDSSNGRDSTGQLVLRFSAIIGINPEYFKFANKHMLAIGPSGRYNVTDSYVQVQGMFSQKAADCSASDTTCKDGN